MRASGRRGRVDAPCGAHARRAAAGYGAWRRRCGGVAGYMRLAGRARGEAWLRAGAAWLRSGARWPGRAASRRARPSPSASTASTSPSAASGGSASPTPPTFSPTTSPTSPSASPSPRSAGSRRPTATSAPACGRPRATTTSPPGRRENSWRGGDARFQGAAMSNPSGKHLVRLASGAVGSSSPRGGAALTPAAPSGRLCAHTGGRTLRATSPPPPSPPPPCSITSAACWDSRALLLDGEEDWEEVVAVGDEAVGAEDAALDAGEGAADDYGVVFGAPPTGDEVRAAVASIQQVFENPSGVDSDAPELQALALPISGLPSSGMFVNYFAEDSCASENQIVQLANLEHSPSYTGLEEWIEPAALVLNSTALFTREHRNVLDAFHLLQVDSSVQKMVMALSTDKVVWDAVMNNKVVQEFKRSFKDAKETDLKGSSSAPPGVMQWVLENTQAKIKEFLEKILKLVNILFQAQSKDYDLYDDVVRMSFMLSVLVFIVVTIARIK